MKFLKRVKAALSEVLDDWSEVPNCPACKGTGRPSHSVFREWVYWKGQLVEVCHNCMGRGKV